MTRKEKHEARLLTTPADELTNAEFRERRELQMTRRSIAVGIELRKLAPADMTRRHRRNALHPNARAKPWDGVLRSRNVYRIHRKLTPPEGLPVVSKADEIAALRRGEIGRMTAVTVVERAP